MMADTLRDQPICSPDLRALILAGLRRLAPEFPMLWGRIQAIAGFALVSLLIVSLLRTPEPAAAPRPHHHQAAAGGAA